MLSAAHTFIDELEWSPLQALEWTFHVRIDLIRSVAGEATELCLMWFLVRLVVCWFLCPSWL